MSTSKKLLKGRPEKWRGHLRSSKEQALVLGIFLESVGSSIWFCVDFPLIMPRRQKGR